MTAKRNTTAKGRSAGKRPRRKALRALIPEELDRQIEELVKLGWFPSRQYIVEEALRKYLSTRCPEMLEKFISDDVEKARRGE